MTFYGLKNDGQTVPNGEIQPAAEPKLLQPGPQSRLPEISFTDDLGKPVEAVQIDLSQPSSLVNYARSQVLHLLVAPDFVALRDRALAEAAPQPIQFQATLGNSFQLGAASPAITLTPKVHAVLRADAAHAGEYGQMVSLRGQDIGRVPLADAVRQLKLVPESRYDDAAAFFG